MIENDGENNPFEELLIRDNRLCGAHTPRRAQSLPDFDVNGDALTDCVQGTGPVRRAWAPMHVGVRRKAHHLQSRGCPRG